MFAKNVIITYSKSSSAIGGKKPTRCSLLIPFAKEMPPVVRTKSRGLILSILFLLFL